MVKNILIVSLSFREYALFAISLVAAVWFFVGYPSQDPRIIIEEMQFSDDEAEQVARRAMQDWGYAENHFDSRVSFESNHRLLDTLQKKLGRPQFIEEYRAANSPNVKPFFWGIQFRPGQQKKGQVTIAANGGDGDTELDEGVHLRIDQQGKVIELRNPSHIVPLQTVNRKVLAAIFEASQDTVISALSVHSDTALSQHLSMDLQANAGTAKTIKLEEFVSRLSNKKGINLSQQDFIRMGTYYLAQTGWDSGSFEADTVQITRINSESYATATFTSIDKQFELPVSIDVALTASGGLLELSADYDLPRPGGNNNGILEMVRTVAIFLFGLTAVVMFFFRIRQRAIDTNPALVVSILCGLAMSVMLALFFFSIGESIEIDGGWPQILMAFFMLGLAGAGTALAFFVLFSIGDSITRQYWSNKLSVYDYLRQGLVFNKPLGGVLIRSVLLAFVLVGVWTLILWLSPQLYVTVENVFATYRAVWPPVYLVLHDALFSFLVLVGVFLIIGGQVFGQTNNIGLTAVILLGASALVAPVTGAFGPQSMELWMGAGIGFLMVLIYLKWDFLTLLLSHFFFLGLIDTASGWIITGSPDQYIFVLLLALMCGILIAGIVIATKGKKEKLLSKYVPQYVEELAQEERIKQELQIAREVQQSFLPTQKPHFEGLDMAAICKPAYETGGDYYDFIQLDEHRIAVTIGDVSGKGFQAAFYMTFIKGILHSLCREIDSPSEVLKKANRLFCDNARRGTFISLVYGIVDLEKKTFTFARAGHNPILKVGGNNRVVEELKPRGLGLGLSKDTFDEQIQEIEISIKENEVLILYTDGIVEALNEHHKFYGNKRFTKMVEKNAQKSAKQILDLLAHDVHSFIGEAKQHDDMTIMVMKLNGHSK